MRRIELYLVCTILIGVLAIGLSPSAQAQAPPCAGSAATSTASCGSSPSSVSDPFLVTFDENGNATISVNGGPTTTLKGTLMLDPTAPPASGAMVLTYMLPEPVITGTVSFTEPSGGTSDWLRFTNATGAVNGGSSGPGALMLFYSDIEANEPLVLADVGPPPVKAGDNTLACGVNPFCAGEIGPENGNNGFDYRPGGVPAPQNNEYKGISDTVPEPTSLTLLGCGLVAAGFVRRRRLCRQG